jgi:hypothetical protein
MDKGFDLCDKLSLGFNVRISNWYCTVVQWITPNSMTKQFAVIDRL